MSFRTALVALVLFATQAAAESPLLSVPNFPQFVMLGVGAGPQYYGSDKNTGAAVPAAQYNFGRRYVSLQANYLSINLVDDPHWQAGPAGILRFGRHDVDDPQVAALGDVDMSLDLGGFVAYQIGGPDPRSRWRLNAGVLQDVTGTHGGFVADVGVRRWVPVGKYGALGMSVASSWASEDYMDTYFSVDAAGAAVSGLPVFTAGSGWRDVRAMAVFIQPLSRKWAVGAGVLYSYMLDGAADSPVTLSRDQVYFGVGVARSF